MPASIYSLQHVAFMQKITNLVQKKAKSLHGKHTRFLLKAPAQKIEFLEVLTLHRPAHSAGNLTAAFRTQSGKKFSSVISPTAAFYFPPSTFFTASSRFSLKSIFPKPEERGSFNLKSERRQNSAFPSFMHTSNTCPPSFLSSERQWKW